MRDCRSGPLRCCNWWAQRPQTGLRRDPSSRLLRARHLLPLVGGRIALRHGRLRGLRNAARKITSAFRHPWVVWGDGLPPVCSIRCSGLTGTFGVRSRWAVVLS